MELIVLAVFVAFLAYIAWKTPRRAGGRHR
jgi:hypothetical protein